MQHDASYKRLFSHAELVADLLRGCVREPWIGQLDFDSLERVNASHVDEKLQQKHQDIIWRLRWCGTGVWAYVYLLLEFQSRPDRWMAIRMLNYVALFYDHLLRTKTLKATEPLPVVLPIVLYNGERRWRRPISLKALRGDLPAELERHQPELLSLLIDQGRFLDEAQPAAPDARNLATALFRLEQADDAADFAQTLKQLFGWLQGTEQRHLLDSFRIWVQHVLRPAHGEGVDFEDLEDLLESPDMLQTRIRKWPERWKQEGRQEGRLEGEVIGQRRTIARLTLKRFGPDIEAITTQRLAAIDDWQRLESLADVLLDCQTPEQWLANIAALN